MERRPNTQVPDSDFVIQVQKQQVRFLQSEIKMLEALLNRRQRQAANGLRSYVATRKRMLFEDLNSFTLRT